MLWMVAALTILVSGVLYSVRVDTRVASGHLERARATALLDGALRLAAAELAASPNVPVKPLQLIYKVGEAEIAVDVALASGFIHLNTAPETLLTDLFAHAAALPPDQAATLAQRLIDWRDADEDRAPVGAERAEYEAQGLTYVPRNEHLRRPDDAGQVLGLVAGVYDSIRDLVTTAGTGGDGTVNPLVAPEAVLAVLARGDQARARELVAMRQAGVEQTLDVTSLGLAHASAWTGRDYRLRATYRSHEAEEWSRAAWVSLEGAMQRHSSRLPWRWLYAEELRRIVEPAEQWTKASH
ncbi:MAG: general secretion pathway protein GspK [Rhodocyclales bacterium]|nr:general secretion pathway protein GspK [Rhodocyclales bacterium]